MEREHLHQPAGEPAGASEADSTPRESTMEHGAADDTPVPASEPALEVVRGAVIRAARTRSARAVAKEARVEVDVVEAFIR